MGMRMSRPTCGYWSVTFDRDVEQWGHEFTEHWTYRFQQGVVDYKLRVVGPNGEACRIEDMDKEDAPADVRKAFEDGFREAGAKA